MADEAAVEVSDDLRSALAAAITEHEAPEPVAAEKPKAEAAPELPLEEGRARGPDGKFVKKEEDEEPVAEAAPEEAAAEETPAEEAKPEEPKGLEPPALWKAADKETFKKLPADAQKIVLDIQKRQDADYTKKTQAIAAFRSEYEPVDKMFEPYREVMKQKGFTPRTLIEAWANVEKRLASGPDEAANVIKGLMAGYNVDPGKVALALGLKAQVAPQTEGEQSAPQVQLPPELMQTINGLQQKVNSFEAERAANAQRAQQELGAAVMNEIEKFKSAVDDKGTLLRPHFDDVEQDMTNLALAHKAAGQQVPSLNDLYEKAVWANPSTREKLITAQAQQAEQKRKDEARAKAAAAKKAAVSVTGAPGTGQAPQGRASADKSLREQLEEAADELAA